MNRSLPMATDDADLWSDSHSMDSDDIQSLHLPQSPWLESLSTGSASGSVPSTMSFVHTGQLSPISNGMDIPCAMSENSASDSSASGSPNAPAMAHSASSSASTDTWAMGGYMSADEALEMPHDPDGRDEIDWDSSDAMAVPKLEPIDDDDFCMEDLKEAPSTPLAGAGSAPATDQPKLKRPRGRPRKHPLTSSVSSSKITKGRSKTGCLTCRKRKKKCDEAKPRCMNCEKNAVVCEGYPEKQIWKSGKERAEEERLKSRSLPPISIQPIFHGLETVEDMIFWKHYNEHLSTVLTVEGEHKNAFKDMMVPIAVKHQGLMHSILSLASKHIDFDTPYGINILKNNPTTTAAALQERSLYHHDQARLKFYDDVEFSNDKPNPDFKILVSARYGQMLCFLLEALAEGNPRGEHRLHLSAYQNLISSSPPDDPAFFSFIAEFFQYHIFADELLHSVNGPGSYPAPKESQLVPPVHPPRLLGVADGLLHYLSQITAIRNTIRSNMLDQTDPVVDYVSLYRAAEIDAAIRDWTPHWPLGDSRDHVGVLYKNMMWIYLVRTIYPPSSSAPSSSMASSAISLPVVHSTPSRGRPTSSVVNTPPQSTSTSCASSPRLSATCSVSASCLPNQDLGLAKQRPIGIDTATATDTHLTENRTSPPPIRQPPQHDPRVSLAVDESLAIIEKFKPSDPSQTLLLLPCFVIGTSCFAPGQQDRVRAAVRTARGYTGLRNTDRVMDVLERVWQHMDSGEWAAVWDWPGVARSLGLDFIPA
ncbi:fungal-specific transcription factor domain-containing protein [Lasiosphaeria miniovina]|uniref:Fungal-specific transcription factor domain-containing protein n=1 Tax=Lasiosphaeria miniovina TaxID=1954250 RepID=A0AA40ABR4_9PEZI|nr:fungal-specific transcription factor domain-containing protein [Lasiosphaeria miniovina]KAK0712980.1 fungal-specific transcription factor domain-containing protein [Lasiosphaeria miniovina]